MLKSFYINFHPLVGAWNMLTVSPGVKEKTSKIIVLGMQLFWKKAPALEIWGEWSIPILPLLPVQPKTGVLVFVKNSSLGQIDMFRIIVSG